MCKDNEAIHRTYVLNQALVDLVETWAEEDDRSNSAVVRKLIADEAKRREAQAQKATQN